MAFRPKETEPMSNSTSPTNLGRRKALRVIGQGVVGAVVLARASDAFAVKCDAEIDGKSKKMRKALQYVEKSKQKGKNCANCMQWIKPAEGEKCGGCKLFSGPVDPEGYCLSYAPMKS